MLRELADRTRQKEKLNSSIPSMLQAHCTEVMARTEPEYVATDGDHSGICQTFHKKNPVSHSSALLLLTQLKVRPTVGA